MVIRKKVSVKKPATMKNSITKKKAAVRKKVVAKKSVTKRPAVKKPVTKKKTRGRSKQEVWTVEGKKLTVTQLKDDFCTRIATSSIGINRMCKETKGYPSHTTWMKWLREDDEFAAQYARAREDQADFMFDEMREIADDTSQDFITGDDGRVHFNTEHVQRSRLRIETRKWQAGKLKPKVYGDKLELDVTAKSVDMTDEERAEWLRKFGGQ